MLSCVVTTIGAFIGNANGSEAVTLATSLPTVGLSIMVLLALSSHRAREYAARGPTRSQAHCRAPVRAGRDLKKDSSRATKYGQVALFRQRKSSFASTFLVLGLGSWAAVNSATWG